MGVILGARWGFFSQSDAHANFNRMHTRISIELKRQLASDGSCRFNRMRRRVSIRCTFAFQSIETFFAFLIWILAATPKLTPMSWRCPKCAGRLSSVHVQFPFMARQNRLRSVSKQSRANGLKNVLASLCYSFGVNSI